MENSPLCPQDPVQMPPSPGNLPSFLQLVTVLPFPGFQNICLSLWSLEILPLLICVDILSTGLRVSCTASPLVRSTRMFLRTQPILLSTCRGAEGTTYFEWAVAWLAETTPNSKHARAEDHSGQTDSHKPQGPAHAQSHPQCTWLRKGSRSTLCSSS